MDDYDESFGNETPPEDTIEVAPAAQRHHGAQGGTWKQQEGLPNHPQSAPDTPPDAIRIASAVDPDIDEMDSEEEEEEEEAAPVMVTRTRSKQPLAARRNSKGNGKASPRKKQKWPVVQPSVDNKIIYTREMKDFLMDLFLQATQANKLSSSKKKDYSKAWSWCGDRMMEQYPAYGELWTRNSYKTISDKYNNEAKRYKQVLLFLDWATGNVNVSEDGHILAEGDQIDRFCKGHDTKTNKHGWMKRIPLGNWDTYKQVFWRERGAGNNIREAGGQSINQRNEAAERDALVRGDESALVDRRYESDIFDARDDESNDSGQDEVDNDEESTSTAHERRRELLSSKFDPRINQRLSADLSDAGSTALISTGITKPRARSSNGNSRSGSSTATADGDIDLAGLGRDMIEAARIGANPNPAGSSLVSNAIKAFLKDHKEGLSATERVKVLKMLSITQWANLFLSVGDDGEDSREIRNNLVDEWKKD